MKQKIICHCDVEHYDVANKTITSGLTNIITIIGAPPIRLALCDTNHEVWLDLRNCWYSIYYIPFLYWWAAFGGDQEPEVYLDLIWSELRKIANFNNNYNENQLNLLGQYNFYWQWSIGPVLKSQTTVGENILIPIYLFILILTDMPVNITEGLLSLV